MDDEEESFVLIFTQSFTINQVLQEKLNLMP